MSILNLGAAATITNNSINFNDSDLILNKIPSSDYEVTNKIYVDSLISNQSSILNSVCPADKIGKRSFAKSIPLTSSIPLPKTGYLECPDWIILSI